MARRVVFIIWILLKVMKKNINVSQQFCNDLNEYLIQEFGYKRNCTVADHICGIIETPIRLKRVQLYLRFGTQNSRWPTETLIIARISFNKTRQGHGKNFLQFLIKNIKQYGFTHIGIEVANTSSSSFAEKFGFKPVRDLDRCWCGSIDEINQAIMRLK